MKVAIVGSRGYPLLGKVREYVNGLADGSVVVSGGAKGVDETAVRVARARGLRATEYPVDKVGLPEFGTPEGKAEFRRRAFARNEQIVQAADLVVVFWDEASAGTRNSMFHAVRLNKPLLVYGRRGQAFDWRGQEW